jgi:uncharacterized Fe-S center protein
MKSKVFFLKDFSKLKKAVKRQLNRYYFPDIEILVKLHFGEPGNKNAFTPKDIAPVINGLKELGYKPIMFDMPVAYHSPRMTVKGYLEVVKQRGYDKLADFKISNRGKKIKMKSFSPEVSLDLLEAKNILVLSHVKGHICAGFGGAIKNLGMGANTVASKNLQHSLCQPEFVKECRGCGTCARLCPFGAIKMVKGKAVVNLEKCSGCSICQLNCPYQCLSPKKAIFDDLLAQAACAGINNFKAKVYYINIIKNVSRHCDCHSHSSPLISPDLGVLFSENPVALDTACLDLIKKANQNKDVFKENNHKDPYLQLKFAAGYCRFSPEYQLSLI